MTLQKGDWAQASGGYRGVVFNGHKYECYACEFCAKAQGLINFGRRIPLSNAAFRALNGSAKYPCQGAEMHRKAYEMKKAHEMKAGRR